MQGTWNCRAYHWNQSFTSRHWFVLNTSTSGLGGPDRPIFCSGVSPFRNEPMSLVRYEQISGEKPWALASGITSAAMRAAPSMAPWFSGK